MKLALQRFRPRLLDTLQGYDRAALARDVGAGITVAIVALPLAMAFAIASGLPPQAGLYTAIIAGFLISALGGSNVQIGGPAGAFIVVVYGIIERHGLANLLIATSMAGLLLFAMGSLKLGGLVRFIPVSIVIGFTNGIAVLIGLAQIKDLLGLQIAKLPADFFTQIRTLWRHLDTLNPWALAVGLATLALVVVWPKSYEMAEAPTGPLARLHRLAARVPGTVVALVGSALVVWLAGLPVDTIGTRFRTIPQTLPGFELPEFTWATAKQLVIPTLTLALLGAIESLLCARVADGMARTPKHDPNQELMAQGVANFVTPLFGGMPATGTIARTVTNIRAGGRTPVAGMVHAAVLLVIMLVAAPLALAVPLPALAGILLFVAWNMGEWREFARLRHFLITYRTLLVGTFLLTVVFDLTVAVEMGLVAACGFFIWRMASLFAATPQAAAPETKAVQVVALYGSLFFASVDKVEKLPALLAPGTRHLVLDLDRLISLDTSGIEALDELRETLAHSGRQLWLLRPNPQPASLMRRSGFAQRLGEAYIVDTLDAVGRAGA